MPAGDAGQRPPAGTGTMRPEAHPTDDERGGAQWAPPRRRVERSARSEVLLDLRPLALDVVEATTHEEGLLGDVVVLAVGDLRERLDGVDQRHGRALDAGELLGDVGVLRQEPGCSGASRARRPRRRGTTARAPALRSRPEAFQCAMAFSRS